MGSQAQALISWKREEVAADPAKFTGSPDPQPPDPPNRVILRGNCPKCTHPTSWRYELYGAAAMTDSVSEEQITAIARTVREQGARLHVDEDVTMICDCRQKHRGRDDGKESWAGCGRYWDVHVRWDGPDE